MIAALSAGSGCATFLGYGVCDEPPPATLAVAPQRLSETGLFARGAAGPVAPGVMAYRPRFALWSDGESKERWVYLPFDARIDTSDADAWNFPVGTRLWKQFSRDGRPIETRFMAKLGPAPDAWLAVAYLWNAAGTDAVAAPEGSVDLSHEVPAARACPACHGGVAGRVLGLSAVQIEGAFARRLAAEGRTSRALPARPEGASSDVLTALGYLHANCSHCHNLRRPPRAGARCYDPATPFDLSLRAGDLDDLARSGVYRTALGKWVVPGDAGESPIYRRLRGSELFAPRMPALGTRGVDADGAALVRRWIDGLR